MKLISFTSALLVTVALSVTSSTYSESQSQSDFDRFFLKFKAAVMSADTYELQDLMAEKFDYMGTTDASRGEVFRGLGSGQWPNLQSAVKDKILTNQTYHGKPARFLQCTPSTEYNKCYLIFQPDSSAHWHWKAMVMPEK